MPEVKAFANPNDDPGRLKECPVPAFACPLGDKNGSGMD